MIITIVITHNGTKWIDKCLESLLNSDIPLKILVIDNASTDGTPDTIRLKFPEVEVIILDKNIGFGKANNIGLKRVFIEKADYAFLLNQDAWIEPDTISKLVAIHKTNIQYGVLSPLHISGDGINLDNSFTNYVSGYSCPGIISDYFLRREIKAVYETSFVNAAFWLISLACIEKIGGFDPLYIHYGEDDDYINRLKYHGFNVGICPSAIGYHDRPQNTTNSTNWSSERIFCSTLTKLKNLYSIPPPKKTFIKKLLKLEFYSLFNKDDKRKHILTNQLIIRNYNQIITNRIICQNTGPSFLN